MIGRTVLLAITTVVALASCEDEEMAAESKAQGQRIEALRAELSVHKVKLDPSLERDPSARLEEVEFEIENLKGAVSDLESELKQIKKDRAEVEGAFDDYQKKYPVES